jgi:hypothetical protein
LGFLNVKTHKEAIGDDAADIKHHQGPEADGSEQEKILGRKDVLILFSCLTRGCSIPRRTN